MGNPDTLFRCMHPLCPIPLKYAPNECPYTQIASPNRCVQCPLPASKQYLVLPPFVCALG